MYVHCRNSMCIKRSQYYRFFLCSLFAIQRCNSRNPRFLLQLFFEFVALLCKLYERANDKTLCKVFQGLTDCVMKTVRSDGVRGLYKGFTLAIQTYFVYRGVYFGLYDALRRAYEGREDEENKLRKLNFVYSFLLAEVS